jgi:hypothetical protein
MTPTVQSSKAILAVRAIKPPLAFTKISAEELLAQEIPPPEPIVDGLLYAGSLALLSAPPKTGKSFMATGLAGAVATGRDALGGLKVQRPGRVLYFALEDGRARLRARIEAILGRADRLDNITIVHELPCPLSSPDGLAALEQEVRAGGYVLVIVDTLVKACPPDNIRNGNHFQADYDRIDAIRKAVTPHGPAVLVITHTRKAGPNDSEPDAISSVAGTGGLTAAADAILSLKKANGGKTASLEVISRDFPEVTYQLQRGPDLAGWEVVGGADEPAPAAYERVLAALPADGSAVELKAIVDAFANERVERGTVQVWLNRAKDAGLVEKAAWGRWKLKRPAAAAGDSAESTPL